MLQRIDKALRRFHIHHDETNAPNQIIRQSVYANDLIALLHPVLNPVAIVMKIELAEQLAVLVSIDVAKLQARDEVHATLLEHSHPNLVHRLRQVQVLLFDRQAIHATLFKHGSF